MKYSVKYSGGGCECECQRYYGGTRTSLVVATEKFLEEHIMRDNARRNFYFVKFWYFSFLVIEIHLCLSASSHSRTRAV